MVLRTCTETPLSSISLMRVSGSKQFASTVLKNRSPTYMSSFFDWVFDSDLESGLCCRRLIHSLPCEGSSNCDMSGSEGGIMCVCISIRKLFECEFRFSICEVDALSAWPLMQLHVLTVVANGSWKCIIGRPVDVRGWDAVKLIMTVQFGTHQMCTSYCKLWVLWYILVGSIWAGSCMYADASDGM